MIIEIVMAAAEMVLKASDTLILEFLMWRPVRPQKCNNKLCCCYFCSVLSLLDRTTMLMAMLHL